MCKNYAEFFFLNRCRKYEISKIKEDEEKIGKSKSFLKALGKKLLDGIIYFNTLRKVTH